MSNYQSLYRKWRPQDFNGIVGQRHIVTTLQKSIESDKISHAYLFCGPRGTGKTTAARVLAKAMNCVEGPTTRPCNKCLACTGIDKGNFLDVIEIDAASNRGIDEVRSLRDSARLAASSGKKKVYIIDEVHMLTTEAFNALLKLLEEPPGHVLFILATTEVHKILQTIISRCQRFDFKPISADDVKDRLKHICDHEKISATDEALYSIARISTGSLRDALSTLEQLSSSCDGEIDQPAIDQVLGTTGLDLLKAAVDILNNANPSEAIQFISSLIKEGANISQFTGDLIAHLRNLVLLSYGTGGVDLTLLTKCNETQFEELKKHAQDYDKEKVMQWCLALANAESSIKDAVDQRLKLETIFFELQRPSQSVEALIEKVNILESKFGGSSPARTVVQPESKPAAKYVPEEPQPQPQPQPQPKPQPWPEPRTQPVSPEPIREALDKPKAEPEAPVVEQKTPEPPIVKAESRPAPDQPTENKQPEKEPQETKEITAAAPSGDFSEKWREVLKGLKKKSPTVFMLLAGCQPEMLENELTLTFKPFASQHKEKLEANMKILDDIVQLVFGENATVKCTLENVEAAVEEVKIPAVKIVSESKDDETEDIFELIKEQFNAELIEES